MEMTDVVLGMQFMHLALIFAKVVKNQNSVMVTQDAGLSRELRDFPTTVSLGPEQYQASPSAAQTNHAQRQVPDTAFAACHS